MLTYNYVIVLDRNSGTCTYLVTRGELSELSLHTLNEMVTVDSSRWYYREQLL